MISRRNFLERSALALGSLAVPKELSSFPMQRTAVHGMRFVSPECIATVADTPGIYHHSAGIVATRDGLVCVYRTSDQHIASWVNINMAVSSDGGQSWHGNRVLSRSSFEQDRANWIAPQTSLLRDGRIAVLVDRGVKLSPFDWPALSQWQMPDRGMSNYLLLSSDGGNHWEPPRRVDETGGEPSYILQLSNGSIMYTRTDSAPTTAKKSPALPWGNNYYKSTAVSSDDGGRSFSRTSPIFDDPLIGDCEVGIAEYAPGKIIAVSRVGDGGSQFNQPSRIAYSNDCGRTWSKPRLAPIYAHRPCVRALTKVSGGEHLPLFVTFRSAANGITGTMACRFDPEKDYGYQPNSFIWEENRCRLEPDGLHLRTEEGTAHAAEFSFYPIEDDDSSARFEATGAVLDADTYGCNLCCGAWIRLEPNRLSLAERPEIGFALDARRFHRYLVAAENHRLRVSLDGAQKLDVPLDGIFNRNVRLGNRRGATPNPPRHDNQGFYPDGGGYTKNRSHSLWKSLRISVRNRRDHSIDWSWDARQAVYPDQFRRDHLILLEKNGSFAAGNSGYSGWTETPSGNIVVADYTCTERNLPKPILRAYRLRRDEID